MDYVTHCHPIKNIRSPELLMKVIMRGFDNKKKSRQQHVHVRSYTSEVIRQGCYSVPTIHCMYKN